MVKRSQKKKKRSRMRTGAVQVGLLLLAGAFATAAFRDVLTYYNLNMEIKANTELLARTKAEQEELETTKKNLTNPDYLEFVARGRYHVSKSGEQVFVFPALSQAENAGPVSEEPALSALPSDQASSAPASEGGSSQADASTALLPEEPQAQTGSEDLPAEPQTQAEPEQPSAEPAP